MACPTCRDVDKPDTCGSVRGKPCPCCGMVIIAESEEPKPELNQDESVSEGTNDTSEE